MPDFSFLFLYSEWCWRCKETSIFQEHRLGWSLPQEVKGIVCFLFLCILLVYEWTYKKNTHILCVSACARARILPDGGTLQCTYCNASYFPLPPAPHSAEGELRGWHAQLWRLPWEQLAVNTRSVWHRVGDIQWLLSVIRDVCVVCDQGRLM